jgi:hypothetical protein
MFEDLQTTTIENAHIAGSQVCLKHFLMTIHFLQCYPTEHEISAKFGIDEKTARKWIKFFVLRIHALKPQKVRCMHKYTLIHILLTIFLLTTLQIIWPRQWDNIYGASNFIISVDEFGYDDPLNVAKFASRLRSARTQVLNDRCRAASDKALLEHDRTIHPKQPMNYRGEPEWDGSEAQEQLRKDMDEGKHTTMKPLLLYSSHEEYKKFPLAVFRKHIYQETNRRKFLAQHNAQKRQRHEN